MSLTSNLPATRWIQDLQRLLPIRSQFVISGSIRDSFLIPVGDSNALVPFARALWDALKIQDYRFLLIYDPTDGIRVYPDEPVQRELASRLFDLKLSDGCQIISLESLAKLMKKSVPSAKHVVPWF